MPWVLLGAFRDDSKALRTRLDLVNGIEEVEWEAVSLDLPYETVSKLLSFLRNEGLLE